MFNCARALDIQPAKASGTIYIRVDGSIDPPDAPISSVDNITYTIKGNINNSIIVERDNIAVDGAGYTLQGAGSGNGITLTDRINVTVGNMTIENFACGIWLVRSSNNVLSGNNVANSYYGIKLSHSSNNTLSGNNVTVNFWQHGVYLICSSNNNVTENIFIESGLFVRESYGNVVRDNIVNGKPLVYLEEVSGYTVKDAGQVILVRCKNITVENLNLSNTDVGVELWETNNTKIANNEITNNWNEGVYLYKSSNNSITGNKITNNWGSYGIYLSSSSNNSITGNNIANKVSGICLSYSSNNRITGNNITNHKWPIIGSGIYLSSSSNNSISHNNFIDNTRQIKSTYSMNTWDDGYPSGGNYWSDYNGTDPNHDGIGDVAYVIDENNQDNYPLSGIFSSFNTSLGKYVNVISNSTIDDFEYFESNSTIKMYVSKMTTNQTHGFCRVCIPKDLMSPLYYVIIDDGSTEVFHMNDALYDNGTHRSVYFAYEHSIHEIDIIPEFPSFLILPLFMIATLVAAIVCGRERTL